MDKTAKKHLDAIRSGEVTKTNIIGIRKLLNAVSRAGQGYSNSRTASKASFEDVDAILTALYFHSPKVAGELHESGLMLLRNKRYAKRLEPVEMIITNLDHFELVNFLEMRTGQFYPVYRAVSKTGGSFDFYNVPWQSGGNGPEIV